MPPAFPENPRQKTRRTLVRRGYFYDRPVRRVRVRGYSYKRGRRRVRVRGYSYVVHVRVHVPALYKSVPIRVPQAKKRRRPPAPVAGVWTPVKQYETRLRKQFNVVEIEPLFRFNQRTDVINESQKFIWSAALPPDGMGGFKFPKKVFGFRGIRIWLLVTDIKNRNVHKIYSYNILADTNEWAKLLEYRDSFFRQITEILERKEGYLEVDGLVAWTVYVKIADKYDEVPHTRQDTGGTNWSVGGRPGLEKMHRTNIKRTYKT